MQVTFFVNYRQALETLLSPVMFTILTKVKVKVKLSLCLTKHRAMKTYWGVEVLLHVFLTSGLYGGEWSASRSGRFTPRERAHGTRWTGGWVGPRAGLDTVVKRKIPMEYCGVIPELPSRGIDKCQL
jgi:hypothetical protein